VISEESPIDTAVISEESPIATPLISEESPVAPPLISEESPVDRTKPDNAIARSEKGGKSSEVVNRRVGAVRTPAPTDNSYAWPLLRPLKIEPPSSRLRALDGTADALPWPLLRTVFSPTPVETAEEKHLADVAFLPFQEKLEIYRQHERQGSEVRKGTKT
jgi:hypothetical protein